MQSAGAAFGAYRIQKRLNRQLFHLGVDVILSNCKIVKILQIKVYASHFIQPFQQNQTRCTNTHELRLRKLWY